MSRSLGSLGQPALLLLTTLLRPSLFPLPMERRLLTAPRGVPTLGSAFTLLLPRRPGPQGCVAPRWTVVGAPAHWVVEAVSQWVAARGFGFSTGWL